jgi:hypothetical protein
MRTFGIIMLCILAVIGGGVAWCNFAYPTYIYRYRMTVEVNVDGVVHSGSSVIEVHFSKQPRVLPEVLPVIAKTTGEAVFVDLGGGRNVIALLASGPNASNYNFPDQIVPRLFDINILNDGELQKVTSLRGRREIPEQYLPTFVTLSDLSAPRSVRVVKPDEFSQVLGPGVRFKGASIEMTDNEPTSAIGAKLPVLMGKLREEAKISRIERLGDPFRITSGQFERHR